MTYSFTKVWLCPTLGLCDITAPWKLQKKLLNQPGKLMSGTQTYSLLSFTPMNTKDVWETFEICLPFTKAIIKHDIFTLTRVWLFRCWLIPHAPDIPVPFIFATCSDVAHFSTQAGRMRARKHPTCSCARSSLCGWPTPWGRSTCSLITCWASPPSDWCRNGETLPQEIKFLLLTGDKVYGRGGC